MWFVLMKIDEGLVEIFVRRGNSGEKLRAGGDGCCGTDEQHIMNKR
jgi:hypothetical protein